nr:thermonuclease family protein [Klebsiella pneumoniae]
MTEKEVDRYGRTLGVVYAPLQYPGGQTQLTNINAIMVQEGMAWAYRYYGKPTDAQMYEYGKRGPPPTARPLVRPECSGALEMGVAPRKMPRTDTGHAPCSTRRRHVEFTAGTPLVPTLPDRHSAQRRVTRRAAT